jgi:zinc transporter ZupT
MVGGALSFLVDVRNKTFIKSLMAFSGAFLFTLTIRHFLPEIMHEGNQLAMYVLIGFLIQLFLDFYSKGIEHGHFHLMGDTIPIGLFVSLCIHAFMEGIPLHFGHSHAAHPLLLGIIIHKIPVALILAGMMRIANYSTSKIFLALVLFALMSPAGQFIGDKVPFFSTHYLEILALVSGIFLHVSTTILFESSESHKFNYIKMFFVLLGVALAFLV